MESTVMLRFITNAVHFRLAKINELDLRNEMWAIQLPRKVTTAVTTVVLRCISS